MTRTDPLWAKYCGQSGTDTANGPVRADRGRFAPGQSGNRKGRPPKVHRPQSAMASALADPVNITEANGKKRKVLPAVVIAKRIVQKAMAGDLKAYREIKAEQPGLLTQIMQQGEPGSFYDGFFDHLIKTMSKIAVEEFRQALMSFRVNRLEELQSGNPPGTMGRRRRKNSA